MKAHELLSGPERLAKGTFARDASGNPVDLDSAAAVSWCAWGAIKRCYSFMDCGELEDVLYDKVGHVPAWSDAHTYEEVHSVLVELDI